MEWRRNIKVQKDPDSVLDYVWDWSTWLAADSDTISTHVVTADSGITIDSSTDDDDSVTVWVSGGTAETFYTVAVKITTTGGRTVERSVIFKIRQQ